MAVSHFLVSAFFVVVGIIIGAESKSNNLLTPALQHETLDEINQVYRSWVPPLSWNSMLADQAEVRAEVCDFSPSTSVAGQDWAVVTSPFREADADIPDWGRMQTLVMLMYMHGIGAGNMSVIKGDAHCTAQCDKMLMDAKVKEIGCAMTQCGEVYGLICSTTPKLM